MTARTVFTPYCGTSTQPLLKNNSRLAGFFLLLAANFLAMAEEETIALKKEMERLNRVIDSLVSFNNRLTAENAYLKSLLSPQNSGYTTHNSNNGISKPSDANVNFNDGITKHTYTIDKIYNGITNNSGSTESFDNGITNRSYSTPKSEDGISKPSDGTASFEGGITTNTAALPATISLTPEHTQRLAGNLKGLGFVRLSTRTLLSVAKILLHLYNNGDGGNETFRNITGLSKGGQAKLIVSLKKRGVITRTGYRQFRLPEPVRQTVGLLFAQK